MTQKIPALGLALVLLAGLPAAVASTPAAAAPRGPVPTAAVLADTAPVKEEVVYAHLAADGTVERILVVNAFPDAPAQFVDHGRYRTVSNLSTTDALDVGADGVTVETAGEEFYYQGELISTDAPWSLDLEYVLDGRKVTAEELRGQSGDLEIRGSVRPNPAVDPVYFENYMLQVSITLDSEYFSRVTGSDATIASQGSAKLVTVTAMPGEDTDFTVSAVARNAHLGQIQAAGLPFSMAVDLPDPGAYTADLVQLKNAIADLAAGVRDYTDGVQQVADASGGLAGGADELAAGARQVSAGFDQLAAGRGQFDAGLREYTGGVRQFADGLGQLDTGIGAFAAGVGHLADGSAALSSGLREYAEGMDGFSEGLDRTAGGSTALVAGLTELAGGLAELTVQGKYADDSLVGGSAQIRTALTALAAGVAGPVTDEDASALRALLAELTTSLDALDASVAAVDPAELRATATRATDRLTAAGERLSGLARSLQDRDAIVAELGITVTDNPEAQALLDHLAAEGARLADETTELDAIAATWAALDLDGLTAALDAVGPRVEAVRSATAALDAALAAPRGGNDLASLVGTLNTQYEAFHGGLVAYVDGVEGASVGLAGEPGCLAPDPADPQAAPVPVPCNPELAERYPHLVTGTPGALAGAHQLRDGLVGLAGAGSDLASGASDLARGGEQLHAGVLELEAGTDVFAAQAGQVGAGASRLADGGDALVRGHGDLMGGDAQFAGGLGTLASGLTAFGDGTGQLVGGLATLGRAGQDLSWGADTLREETRYMDQEMEEQMDEAMADFLPRDFTLTSFTSDRNTGIERVQFVYLVDAQVEQEPETAPVEEEEAAPRSWWERILDIFRGRG